ncbi:protein kinase domain-containing protein [Embleya sp. AB8]|uniref:serine/threonine-protein kinase n=1 Tax=Embleya sp. AB8 TaxID=3156304 RepID=UPI003C78BD6E
MDEDLARVLAGRYRLIGKLGQGGMGTVWRAHDEQLDREVAVKELRLPEHLTAAERDTWITRLDREARAAARLKHPGIVTVHDRITDADQHHWIVMELVHGGSLADLIAAQGPLPREQVARIGLLILDALRAAHQAGITHRDIKPANILLEESRVVLTDFGIAAVAGDATLTVSGMLVGTPAYMAPEQVRGLPATAESDLWSLGATLYTAVEGRPPFAGTNPGAVLVAVATDEPATALYAGPLEPVLRGLLCRDPAERLTLDQLQAVLAPLAPDRHTGRDEPVPAPHQEAPTAPPRPGRPPNSASPPVQRRRGPTWIMLVTVAVLALAVGGSAVGYVMYDRGRTDEATSMSQVNLRAARDLQEPAGFTRQSETGIGAGKVRVTYKASDACTTAMQCRDKVEAITTWLKTRPGVAAVLPPRSGLTGQGCTSPGKCPISITPAREPSILNGQLYTENGDESRLLFQIDIG